MNGDCNINKLFHYLNNIYKIDDNNNKNNKINDKL
jgi:hypothetical protein